MAHRRTRVLALAAALLAGCTADPALGRHVDHPAFRADVAWGLLTDQVAFGPRIPGTRSHERALGWLVDQLGFRADTVVVQRFTAVNDSGKTVAMTNVLARFRPRDPRRILLVAHWDTHPRADESQDPYDHHHPVPGANDGASGTAALLAVAQALHEQAPTVGVDLLFTDGDDYRNGVYLGTEAFLRERPAGYRPAFAIVAGIVADARPWLPPDAVALRSAPAIVHRVWGIAREMKMDSLFSPDPVPYSTGADLPLSRAGIATVLLNDPELGPGNSYWHTVRDLPGNASRETLGAVGAVLTEVVYRGVPEGKR